MYLDTMVITVFGRFQAPSTSASWRLHIRIKKFYGTSANAVKVQIRTAVSVYVLVATIKKRRNLDVSLHTLLQVFPVTLFEKMPVKKGFFDTTYSSEDDMLSNQLDLLNY